MLGFDSRNTGDASCADEIYMYSCDKRLFKRAAGNSKCTWQARLKNMYVYGVRLAINLQSVHLIDTCFGARGDS